MEKTIVRFNMFNGWLDTVIVFVVSSIVIVNTKIITTTTTTAAAEFSIILGANLIIYNDNKHNLLYVQSFLQHERAQKK